MVRTISVTQLKTAGERVIDVRSLDEFARERLPGATCIPLDKLMDQAQHWDPGERLLLICRSGIRSAQAVERLEAAGFKDVLSVDGGMEACKRAGLDVVIEKKRIPLFRQVMIVAGSMLLIGLIGAALWHPAAIYLSWFVACGLVFAGVTGFCPMEEILKRLPWNRFESCGTECGRTATE